MALVTLTVCQTVHAGLYSAHEACPFTIRDDGTAEELSYFADESGVFPLDYAKVGNIGDNRRVTPERSAVLKRIETPPVDAADLIRVGNYDAAINLLTSAKPDDFVSQMNLAHLYAMRGDWRDAVRRHEAVLDDTSLPPQLPGASAAQTRWLARVEKDYYRRWLELHAEETTGGVRPEQEKVFRLFEKGEPKDAVAIVQQLLLWCPNDNRLYWLLAELYAKSDRPRQAKKLFDSLASEDRRQSNRRLLMQHREAIHRAVAALPPLKRLEEIAIDLPAEDVKPWYEQLGLSLNQVIGAVAAFAVLAALLLAFQFRKLSRKLR